MTSTSTALVVDDDPICREIVCSYLAQAGWQTIATAENGIEAKGKIEAVGGELALIVTDINMPDHDGVEFMGFLAERRIRCAVLIVSGTPEPIARASTSLAKAGGLNLIGFISKPVSRAKLAAHVGVSSPS